MEFKELMELIAVFTGIGIGVYWYTKYKALTAKQQINETRAKLMEQQLVTKQRKESYERAKEEFNNRFNNNSPAN